MGGFQGRTVAGKKGVFVLHYVADNGIITAVGRKNPNEKAYYYRFLRHIGGSGL
jgi:hypothetical protein